MQQLLHVYSYYDIFISNIAQTKAYIDSIQLISTTLDRIANKNSAT